MAVGLWVDGPVHAQRAEVRILEDTPRRTVVEVVASWPNTLRASLDSARVTRLSSAFINGIAKGLPFTSETIRLNTLTPPQVHIESSEFDEVAIPWGKGKPGNEWTAAPAKIEGIGMERKHIVGSLKVRLFSYDDSGNTLRRYRRIRLAVEKGSGGGKALSRSFLNPHLQISKSILADGIIFKIPVQATGIYRIDRQLLSAIGSEVGLNPDDIEPDDLQIFGNGGAPLPGKNDDPRVADLVENPVFVRGGGDGSFDDGDILLFYAAGPIGWKYDDVLGEWVHYVHPFSNSNYYFLKIGTGPGQRVEKPAFPGISGVTTVNHVTGRFVEDVDEIVWSKERGSGHTWVSTQIRSGGSRDILTGQMLPGQMNGDAEIRVRAAIGSNPVATLAISANGAQIGQLRAPFPIGRGAEDPTAVPVEAVFTQNLTAGAPLDLSMQLLQQINEPQAAIDWVRILYPRALRGENGYLRFATPAGSSGWLEMNIEGFSGEPQIWDVTRPGAVRRLGLQKNGNNYRVQLQVDDPDAPHELVAFSESAASSIDPGTIKQVPNQDLHGIKFFPDFVIVAPAAFLKPANDLAKARRQEGLRVAVTPIEEIYNEFSGGVPDMRAVRDYLKFIYDRAPSEDRLLKYVLFMGDGHFDFRELEAKENEAPNLIFPYETVESFVPDRSFTSDDYFGLLDDSEGAWVYSGIRSVSNERLDVGIGRLPVQSVEEAQMMVDKILHYESPETLGPWRSLYTFVADDGPNGLAGINRDFDLHMQNVDQVAELVRGGLAPSLNVKKIYAESFQRVFLNGFRIPGAKKEIFDALNQGTLLFNYSGHGGPEGLAQEELFTKEDAVALTNKDHPAIFVTATCSFGWWDIEDEQSGAEVLLLNPNGGAVALMTTVRLVYTSSDTTSLNAGLNRALNQKLLTMDEDGIPRRLGDVMRLTKNTSVGLQGNSRKFNLLGDPTMRLGIPFRDARVEKINGVDIQSQQGQMRALDRVTVNGTVRTQGGDLDDSFDGTVDVTVFDASRRVSLLRQVYMPNPYYTVREDLIWRGEVQAQRGQYSATFVVPKDISYSDQPGRISVYVSSGTTQADGFSENFIVGGTSAKPPNDSDGPQISLFLNDTTFVSGGLTTADPELIVKLFDDSGINTVGAGVGHEMLLVLNGEEGKAIDISSAFQSEENSYQRGEVHWPLPDLNSGENQLSVRAWDVLNNSGTSDLQFVVTQDQALELRNVFNYPNPMSRRTQFVFEHNQPPGTEAQVRLRIYTLAGRPVRTIDGDEALPGGVLPGGPVQIPWDGRDEDFDRVSTGIYLYKVRVEVERGDGQRSVAERIEKLAVIR